MADKIVKMLEEQASRRTVFSWLGGACMAFVMTLLGMPRPAHGLRSVFCCVLCGHDCSSTTCPFFCSWSWTCCHNGTRYSCLECYYPYGSCSGNCNGFLCSKAYSIGSC